MKLSCLPVSLYPELTAGTRSLADWFRFAAELGLDGADVSVVHLPGRTPADLRPVRQQAEEAGVRVTMLVTYADFTHPDAGIEWAVAGLTACLDKAAKTGVTLCYENHTKGYAWTYNDFSQPADRFLEIVRRTEGTSLRLLYDTANTLGAGDDPLAVLAAVKHRVSMVHVNDIRRAGFFEPCLLGEGVAPVQQIFEVLVQNGFDGWVSVEEASKNGEAGFRIAIPRAEQLWIAAGGAARAR
jgi:sugar phosphate isomerase/epimerase